MAITIQPEATDLFYSARGYVDDLLKTQLPVAFSFHTLAHTHEVIIACNLIAANENIDPETHENLLLATCFHGTGYIQSADDHENASIEIATAFLHEGNISKGRVQKIAELIKATKPECEPRNLEECIIRDAAAFYVSKSNYQEYLLQLRRESEYVINKKFSDKEWLLMNLNFLNEHKYFTRYANENWEEMKINNIGFMEKVLSIVPY